MSHYIKKQATQELMETIKSGLREFLAALEPFKVPLNKQEKGKRRAMAASREGYARAVSHIAGAHENSLARNQDPAELVSKLQYDSSLEELRQLLLALTETITDTQMANGIDTMSMVDLFVTNLQVSRQHDAALDNAMSEIDDWNKRFAHRKVAVESGAS